MSPLTEPDPGVVPKGKHWVDMADEGTVVVIEQPSGQTCAALGGIMATRMKVRGVEACIVGGRVRDLAELRKSGLPVSDKQTNCTSASRQLLWLSPFHHRMLSSVLVHFSTLVLPSQSQSESPSRIWRLRRIATLICSQSARHTSHFIRVTAHLSSSEVLCVCLVNFLFLYFAPSHLSDFRARFELILPQVWALGKSTVGSGAEAKVYARNTPVSICGLKITPVSRYPSAY